MSEKKIENCGCTPNEDGVETAKAAGQGCCPPTPSQGKGPLAPAKDACCPPSDIGACAPSKDSCCSPAPSSVATACESSDSAACASASSAPGCSDTEAAAPLADSMERPGVRVWGFVKSWLDTSVGQVPKVSHEITRYDMLGRWAMRWGLGRESYRIAPGVYAFGNPTPDSTVLVTCNYKLTFDHLRKSWEGLDVWVLVLETHGVNVWCAAGKGTFGTDELVRRLEASKLKELVNHKRLVLPQLGAPGVSGFEVRKRTGFAVEFGPVRAEDVGAYLRGGNKATDKMRRVHFTILERFILTPVELMAMRKNTLWALLAAFILAGIGPSIWSPSAAVFRGLGLFGAYLVGLFAGGVFTPLLLPWIPGTMFSTKGAVVGVVSAILAFLFFGGSLNWLEALSFLGVAASVSAFVALNFTGATTFTSPTGVEREMRKLIPWQAGALGVSLVLWVIGAFIA